MKIAIVGGNGFLGTNIACMASSFGITPIIIDKEVHPGTQYESFQLDITHKENISLLFRKLDFEVLVNTAAMTNVDGCERDPSNARKVNALAPGNLARECDDAGIKMIQVSTDFVFDGKGAPYSETDKPNPINVYGTTKREGERLVEKNLDDCLICRTSVLYGLKEPHHDHNFFTWVKESLEKGVSIEITTSQYNTPTLVSDLSHMILTLIERGKRGIWHTTGSQCINRFKFATKIADLLDLDVSLVTPVDFFNQIARRPRYACLKTHKIQEYLGIIPKSIEDGIQTILGNPRFRNT